MFFQQRMHNCVYIIRIHSIKYQPIYIQSDLVFTHIACMSVAHIYIYIYTVWLFNIAMENP